MSDAMDVLATGLLAVLLFAIHCLWTSYNLMERFT